MLAAPDGHAKNFSIFIGPGNHFWATPLYDILSAWPVIGNKADEFQWQKMKLAMALRTKNTHNRMCEIQRRHWNEVAKVNAVGTDCESIIEKITSITPSVIESVRSKLPADFPAQVSERIFHGLQAQVRKLNM